MTITEDYVKSLPTIYRDIFIALAELGAFNRRSFGVSIQSVAAHLQDVLRNGGRLHTKSGKPHTLADILEALENLEQGNAIQLRSTNIVPTDLGMELMRKVAGHHPGSVPPFVPPE
jgi:hypothetical protein